MNLVGEALITTAAPYGIISFELAGSVEKAQQIIDSWDQDARLYAAFSLGFDYLFMLLYSTTIALACLWGGRALQARDIPGYRIGIFLAWGLWLAAVLDGIENIALSLSLLNTPAAPVAAGSPNQRHNEICFDLPGTYLHLLCVDSEVLETR